MKEKQILLSGYNLTLEKLYSLVNDPNQKVGIAPSALATTRKNRMFLEQNLTKHLLYGINTGFGPMADHVLGEGQLAELQKNLILSHAAGMGEPINPKFVLAAMAIRLNTLAKGYSAVTEELLDYLCFMINNRIIPLVPEHGAVGTSGDLVQLAHIGLAILGKGKVFHKKEILPAAKVLKKFGRKPYKLKPKEGLSVINGTSVMSGICSLLVAQAEQELELEITLGAMSLEIVGAFADSISEKLHATRPHPGQIYVASRLRKMLKGSTLLKNRDRKYKKFAFNGDVQHLPEAIQEVYSMRCLAQILGPIKENLDRFKQTLEIEINSSTDNPLVDGDSGSVMHGGNFHGEYIAAGIDTLKADFAKLSMLSERRINFFLNNKVNQHFPPFLNLKKPGLTLALQGLQFVATSTTARNQTLSFPHRIHSIPTNGDNQDVVSMGADASLLANEVLKNSRVVQTIEAVTLCQAVDCMNISNKLSAIDKKLYKLVRKTFPKIVEDREISPQLSALMQSLINFNV